MKIRLALLALASSFATSSCFIQNGVTAIPAASTSAVGTSNAPTYPAGPRAVKFFFNNSQYSPQASFGLPAPGGTLPQAGAGFMATKAYLPSGVILANGTSDPNWPAWIGSLELGLSGANNTSANNADCGRFADTNDPLAQCFGAGVANCGAPTGVFRVSEMDCSRNTGAPPTPNGTATDGIYIRTTFNRATNALGATENIMAVIEYTASSINAPPANPVSCLNASGVFDPTTPGCSDEVWRAYLNHSPSEIAQPFLLLVPPSANFANPAQNTLTTGVTAKQIFLPLASDSGLSVFQISRVSSITPPAGQCNGGSIPSNSPFCVGLVLYSITFYRM